MATKKAVRLLRAYASDDRSTFRMDFAWARMKMSGLNVLTGSQGQVRRNCSLLLAGGPFYPVLTGQRDSTHSYFNEGLAEIP